MDETQNDAPFVAFYDMHAVTFVPPDEMADVTIAGLQWFILIPPIKPHGVPIGYHCDTKANDPHRLSASSSCGSNYCFQHNFHSTAITKQLFFLYF